MNTFATVLAALLVRDVIIEAYAMWRANRNRQRMMDALNAQLDQQEIDGLWLDNDPSVEEFLATQVANTNRTQA